MRFIHRLFAGILACALTGQLLRAEGLPELGDVASNELSLATERKIGQQIMDEIRGLIRVSPTVGWGLMLGTLAILGSANASLP